MYCPKCSQQQISDEMRFCSGCGFPLTGVRELIASAVVEPGLEAAAMLPSRGQKNVRRGAWIMLASLVLALFVGFLAAIDDDFAVFLLLPVLCFIVGFARILYGVFIADRKDKQGKVDSPPPLYVPARQGQLPAARNRELAPPQFAPADSFTVRRAQTAEMVQPRSVTENTTRLLEDDSELRRG